MTAWAIILLAVIVAAVLMLIIAQGARNRPASLRDYLDESNLLLDADERKTRRIPTAELAAGIRDMLEEGQRDEAVEIYQKFTGVDQYTAQDAIDSMARDMNLSDDVSAGQGEDAYDEPDERLSKENLDSK